MIKWIKRVLLALLGVLFIAILLFVTIKPRAYYVINYAIGLQMQWYGHDSIAHEMIDESIRNLGNFSASEYHVVSVQNTKNGNYHKAIEYLEKGATLSPADIDGYYGWVLLYYYRDYEKALFHLNRYDSLTPDFDDYVGDDNILFAKGLCYKQLGQHEKALDFFNQALASELRERKEDWVSHQIYFQKGRVLHILGEYQKAIECYDKTIKVWEQSSEAFYYKGLAQIMLKDSVAAHKNFDTALNLVKRGYKTADSYVELFDEVYQMQIEEKIDELY